VGGLSTHEGGASGLVVNPLFVVLSQPPWNASGVLMLFRNEERLRRLWRSSTAARRVLESESYQVRITHVYIYEYTYTYTYALNILYAYEGQPR